MINPIVTLAGTTLASLAETRHRNPYTITIGDDGYSSRQQARRERLAKVRAERAAENERLVQFEKPLIDAAAARRAEKNAKRASSLYPVKIVPDAEPNADGKWVKVQASKNIRSATFADACRRLASQIPAGFHIVAVGGDR